MQSRRALQPLLAILLLCSCALASFRMVWYTAGDLRRQPASNSVEAVIARFEPLRRLLPERSVTGFFVDERHADLALVPSPERFRLAQYALSPRVVEDSCDHALVIVDADTLSPPALAAARRWTLLVDLHNGVKLFRTQGAEMTMVWFAASLLSPWLMAYVLLRRCDPRGCTPAARWLHACLAVGLGLGLSSCTYFLWLVCLGPPGRVFRIVETVGFVGGGLLALAAGRLRPSTVALPAAATSWPPPPAARRWQAILAAVFIAALVFDAIGMFGRYVATPHGDWDAWAIWNARARFLFRAGNEWRQAFHAAQAHADYPLLVPLANARCWSCLGRDPTWVPWLLGVCFTLATVGVLTAGVGRLRGRSQGLLSGMVLLGTKAFVTLGAAQYADVPLAFFILATVLLLALDDAAEQSSSGLLLLAGLSAALAAWTKNEGLLFLFVVLATRGIVAWRRGRGGQALRQLALLAAGAAPALAVVILFKLSLATSNDLVSGQSPQASLSRLLDPSRYWLILQTLARTTVPVGKAYVLVLPLCFFLLGLDVRRPRRAMVGIVGVLSLMLVGYFFIYVTTPIELAGHLRTSADRLLLQLWPAAILAMFLAMADPVELLTERSRS